MPSAENEASIKGFSWGGLLFIILLSIFVCIVCFQSAINYGAVLANDDNNLPDTRGSITFYLWLNVIVGFIALYIFILFCYKLLFGNRNPYQDAFQKALEQAVGLGDFKKVEDLNNCKAIGLADEGQCDEFNNHIIKSNKVAYYLENARYMSDNVNDTTRIYENIFERMCEIKEKAIDCIKDHLETSTTETLYKNGGVFVKDLEKAKEITIENIKAKAINELDKEIKELSALIPGYNTGDIETVEAKLNEELSNLKDAKDTAQTGADAEGATPELKQQAVAAKEAYKNLKKTKEKFTEFKSKKISEQTQIDKLLRWKSGKSKRK